MTGARQYDVVVIGAGPTGENVADRVVKGGLSAVIVEAELVGGECSYWACMPSKALLRPLHALLGAQRVEGSRQAVHGRLDVAAVLARRDSFASNWDDKGQVEWLTGAKVELVRGKGRLDGPGRVAVDTPDGQVDLVARHAVVIATGSDATVPPVTGLAGSKPWTSREATSAKLVPGRLLVMGGGVVGCEMAQAFSALGAKVTILEKGDRLLPTTEPVAGQMVAEAMVEMGTEVRTGVTVKLVSRASSGEVTVKLTRDKVQNSEVTEAEVKGDELLVAAGRSPRTGEIGLETVGLTPGDWLDVDDSLAVNGAAHLAGAGVTAGAETTWLYAAGDVNHRALLTHQGKYQARVCGDTIVARAKGNYDPAPWGRYSASADHGAVPQVIFTDPEVGAVGPTEDRARSEGLNVKAVDYPLGNVAGSSLFADGYKGHARLLVDEDRHVLVGATFVGPGAGELVHAATVAVVGEVPLDRLWHAVPSYPTMSEVWLRLLEEYGL